MSDLKSPFLQAVTDLAKEFDVIAFAISAVLPTEEGFGIASGAASRMAGNSEEAEQVTAAMEDAVKKAIKLIAGQSGPTYMN